MKWFFISAVGLLFLGTIWLFLEKPEVYVISGTSPQEKAVLEFKEEPRKPAVLVFGGDVMLGRYVRDLMDKNGDLYPFQSLAEIFKNGDGAIVNLEGPILEGAPQTPRNSMQFAFKSSTADLLKEVGVVAVSLGNNHGLDHGKDGERYTRDRLEKAQVLWAGNTLRPEVSTSIKYLEARDYRIALISLNLTWPTYIEEDALRIIREAKSSSPNRIVVLPHWGEEYKLSSNIAQKISARAFIDAGADVVIGHHPHVVQEVEEYKGKFIFYSLGNLIFDQYFSRDVEQGLLIKYSISEEDSFEILPIQSKRSVPNIMTDKEREGFLTELSLRSMEPIKNSVARGFLP